MPFLWPVSLCFKRCFIAACMTTYQADSLPVALPPIWALVLVLSGSASDPTPYWEDSGGSHTALDTHPGGRSRKSTFPSFRLSQLRPLRLPGESNSTWKSVSPSSTCSKIKMFMRDNSEGDIPELEHRDGRPNLYHQGFWWTSRLTFKAQQLHESLHRLFSCYPMDSTCGLYM